MSFINNSNRSNMELIKDIVELAMESGITVENADDTIPAKAIQESISELMGEMEVRDEKVLTITLGRREAMEFVAYITEELDVAEYVVDTKMVKDEAHKRPPEGKIIHFANLWGAKVCFDPGMCGISASCHDRAPKE